MNDQVLMREVHCGAHLQKKMEPPRDGKLLIADVLCDRQSQDVFHDEVRQAVIGRSGIEEPRDVTVIEARQNSALGLEATESLDSVGGAFEEIDRDFLLELSVDAFRQVDR